MHPEPAAAIIGTRSPSPLQYAKAKELAREISKLGVRIKTGAAFGIDQAAMEGTYGGCLDVFLPWPGYNHNIIPKTARITMYDYRVHKDWTESVSKLHPAASRLSSGAFSLHARNYGIVKDTKVVIAFPNESGEGGTGQGIRIARHLKVPVVQYNKGAEIPSTKDILKVVFELIGPLPEPIDTSVKSPI